MKKLYSILIAVILLAFSIDAYAVDVSFVWDANPPEEEVIEYRLYYQLADNPPETKSLLVSDLNSTSYTLRNIDNGLWSFWLTAVNEDGESPPTPKITRNLNIPGMPHNFRFTPR